MARHIAPGGTEETATERQVCEALQEPDFRADGKSARGIGQFLGTREGRDSSKDTDG